MSIFQFVYIYIYTFKNIFIVHYKSKCGLAGLYLCKFKNILKYIYIYKM